MSGHELQSGASDRQNEQGVGEVIGGFLLFEMIAAAPNNETAIGMFAASILLAAHGIRQIILSNRSAEQ